MILSAARAISQANIDKQQIIAFFICLPWNPHILILINLFLQPYTSPISDNAVFRLFAYLHKLWSTLIAWVNNHAEINENSGLCLSDNRVCLRCKTSLKVWKCRSWSGWHKIKVEDEGPDSSTGSHTIKVEEEEGERKGSRYGSNPIRYWTW